ncbi:hemagglutinin repeat-containing protein [Pseudoxanthomonas sp. JBR18]|uniref:hemagglutinin repeat-containing protein n=1 Tax=Pseudoxanthomonas sp. JBR18 TaxID=2969308 RepID=UPI002305241B|nr:hemagglutinin repeat-containing protein [Pseudoxanthomonas sp. JBR18]WCE06374.1 hemagglutinin repeat-containing protein [Pseudoxanthomonas sp. JBR18]
MAVGAGASRVHVSGTFRNQDGVLSSNGDLEVDSTSLVNEGGSIDQAGDGLLHIETASLQGVEGSIASNGRLELKGQHIDLERGDTRARDVAISADSLDTSGGRLVSLGDGVMQVQVEGLLRNEAGNITANGAQQIQAGALSNRSGALNSAGTGGTALRVAGALDNTEGAIASNADALRIESGNLVNAAGVIRHAGTAGLSISTGQIDGANGAISTAGALQLDAGAVDHQGASLEAAQFIVDVDALNNRGGHITATGDGANRMDVQGVLDNGDAGVLASNGSLEIQAQTFGNAGGTVQQAGAGNLAITAQAMRGAGGTLLSNGAIDLQVEELDLRDGTTTAQRINVVGDHVVTAGGQLSALGGDALHLQAHSLLDNTGGTLGTNGALDIQSAHLINDNGILIAAGEAASLIRADRLDNRDGAISGNGDLRIEAGSLLGQAGSITAHDALAFSGGTLDLRDGQVQADSIEITADSVDNSGGAVSATGEQAMSLTVREALINDGGTLASNGAQQIDAGSLSNVGGTLSSAGSADTRIEVAGAFDNSQGTLASNADALQIRSGSLLNVAGKINHAGLGGLDLRTGDLQGQQGVIATAGALTLRADTVDHRGATLSAERLDIGVSNLDNRGGSLVATGTEASTLLAQQRLDNGNDGTLASNGALTINAAVFGNAGGTVQQSGTGLLSVDADTLEGQGGSLLSNGALQLTGEKTDLRGGTTTAQSIAVHTGNLITAGGAVTAAGTGVLSLQVRDTLDNADGSLASNGTLDLRAAQLLNGHGTVQAAGSGDNQVSVDGALDNQGGQLLTTGNLTLGAGSLDNRGGTLYSDDDSTLHVTIDGLLNNSAHGMVSAGGDGVVTAQSLDNASGTLAAGTNLQLETASQLRNAGGLVQAGADLHLASHGVDNQTGRIIAGTVDVDSQGQALNNRAGTLASLVGGADLRTGLLDNTGGLVQSVGGLRIDTAGQSLLNTSTDGVGINSAGMLEIHSGALDNRDGAVFSQGTASITATTLDNTNGGALTGAGSLILHAQQLRNGGGAVTVGGDAQITLSGALDNHGGLVAADGTLQLQAASVNNKGTLSASNGPALGLQGRYLQLTTGALDNSGGQVLADRMRLQVSGSLNNTAGQISAMEVAELHADTIGNGGGSLAAGSNLIIGTRQITGTGSLRSQGDMTLDLGQSYTNVGQIAANGTLTLDIQGDLDNQGALQGGGVDISANNIRNEAGAEISSVGLTHLLASGELTNRGLLDGGVTHISAGSLNNIGTGRIYGDHVAIQAGTLNNVAENANGAVHAGTIAARQRLDLGVGTLVNSGKGLIFSDGNAAIGGTLGGNLLASGVAGRLDNLGSTIEISGDLDVQATAINNIRQNVVVTQSTTKKAPVRLDQPTWRNNGSNDTSNIRKTSNYSASVVYYLAPDDILEDTPYITPDGYTVHRAVIRLTPETSAYFFARGGMYMASGERSRLDAQSGTVTVYYFGRQDGQANPDQVASGADDPFAEVSQILPGSPQFKYVDDSLTYSSAYGTCTTNCVQLWAQYAYTDPDHILTNPQGTGGGGLKDNEQYRIATQTVVEDVLQPGAGPEAVIHSGGSMRLGTDALRNEYASIAAGGNLAISGLTRDASVTNLALTLYRTYSFSNVSHAYNGTTRSWSNPSISEKIGTVGAGITANGNLSIDVGSVRNDNTGRDAPNVQDGANLANLDTRGSAVGGVGPGAGAVQGPNQVGGQQAGSASAQGPAQIGAAGEGAATTRKITASLASRASALDHTAVQAGPQSGAVGASAVDQRSAVAASGNDPHLVVTTSPDASAPTASLFNVDVNRGSYLVETDPQFANYRNWLGSDYLLNQMGYSADALQKRLGDGFYEQKLVREQIGELTGRRFLDGYSDDEAQYQALMEAGATVAKQWNLRPGVALTEAQMAQLTSDIVWLVEQEVTLADGTKTKALVPQVYLRVMPGDLDNDGALLAGANVDMKLSGNLVNSGAIAGRQLVTINADNIRNLDGGQISGRQVGLQAKQDIDIIGSTVTASDALSLQAGRNVTVASTTERLAAQGGELTKIDRVAGLYVTGTAGPGLLSVVGGGDVTLQAAQIRNAGTEGLTQLVAAGDLNLTTQTLSRSTDITGNARNFIRSDEVTHLGTSVQGAGNVLMAAGNDVNLTAAQVGAGGALAVQAVRDINSQAVVDHSAQDRSSGSKRNSSASSLYDETVRGTQLGAGGDITLQAGRDLTLATTSAASESGDIALAAGRDVSLLATQEQHDAVADSKRTKKGFLKSKTTTTHDEWHDSLAIGSSLSGETVSIAAGNDLALVGSTVLADGDVRLAAGNDVTIESAQDTSSEAHSASVKKSGLTGGFSGGVVSVGYGQARSSGDSTLDSTTQVASTVASLDGNLTVSAGNQLTIAASDLAAGQNLTLAAKDIQLQARQDTVESHDAQSSKSSNFSVGLTLDPAAAYRSARDSSTQGTTDSGSTMSRDSRRIDGAMAGTAAATTAVVVQAGSQRASGAQDHSASDARVSQLAAGGNLTLLASDGSITSQGAQMSAEGDALLLASQNIVFDVAHNTESSSSTSKGKGWSFANNTSGPPVGTNNLQGDGLGRSDTITGTQLSVGGNASLSTSHGDIALTGSNIVATGDVNLHAARDLTIASGQDTVSNTNQSDSKAIGTVVISDTERFSGWHREQHQDDSSQVTQVASSVGSLGGNVNMSAGGKYTQVASNVVAAGDVDITAASIDVLTADDLGAASQQDKALKIGAFARVNSPFIDLVNNVEAARQSDGRLQAMQGMAVAANAYQAASAVSNGGTLISAEAGVGFSSNKSQYQGQSQIAQGSTISGGGNVSLTSTQGDIHVVQGNLRAGDALSLDSAADLLLEAGQSHSSVKDSGSSKGFEVGVGVAVGAQTGVYAYVQASASSHRSDSDSTTYQNTNLAGQTINLSSQGDTTLRGAAAQANTINVNTGGDLTIESLQDQVQSQSKDRGFGIRVQVALGTAWDLSGGGSAGLSGANGNYLGVTEQAGLFAGDGGFNVNVGGNTELTGAVIASSAEASKNFLSTNSLTVSDLQNQASGSANVMSLAVSSDMLSGSKYAAARGIGENLMSMGSERESRSNTTTSDIAAGLVEIRNGDAQALDGLARSATTPQTALKKVDVQHLQDDAIADQIAKHLVYDQAVKFTDEAYKVSFVEKAEIYEVTVDPESGEVKSRPLSDEEKLSLRAGPDGKVNLATNGIFNGEYSKPEAAASYAAQHNKGDGPLYLVHYPEADNALSELLVAGYQKFLENDFWGLANATTEVKDVMLMYGQDGLHLDGHSRGGMTIGNALESVTGMQGSQGVLSGTTISFFGSAYNAAKADALLSNLQDRSSVVDPELMNSMVLNYQTHFADFVGRYVGGNPATGGTIPDGSSWLKEVRRMLGGTNTVHSCYGSTGAELCHQLWGTSPGEQAEFRPGNK